MTAGRETRNRGCARTLQDRAYLEVRVLANLRNGDGFSVRQVIDQAKHVTNRAVPVTHGARRPGDCTKLVSGSLRAKTELGWSADRSNLKQMITDAWRWHQNGGYIK